jgi:hypothetical protein
MQYFLTILSAPDAEPYVASEDNIADWVKEADERGIRVTGNRLRPLEDATLVRRRKGELLVTDGPFAEGKELILGFDVLECDSIDEALEFAARHPMARFGQIEVREAWPFDPSDEG